MTNLFLAALMSLSLIPYHSTPALFQDYYAKAEQTLASMTVDEKIAQTFLVRYPDEDGVAALAGHQFGGYLFFAKDFTGKSVSEVQTLMATLQSVAKNPILTAVDEEGGTVVRVSSNPQLAPARFASPQEIYAEGGLSAIREDTLVKSQTLHRLGLNLNLAPVVDVSTNPSDYMYSRTLGQDAATTAAFARAVIEASQGTGVSYTLKHFPGYGNNLDTHTGTSIDQRSLKSLFQRDLVPFSAGVKAGAEAILVSHNVVTSLDPDRPASLSPEVHFLLRQGLGFSGVVITDDIAMAAIDSNATPTVQSLLAGNDLVITSDYVKSLREVKTTLAEGKIDQSVIDRAAQRVLAWKYYKKY